MRSILAEYIWIDGFQQLRSKNRIFAAGLLKSTPPSVNMSPDWNFDGSSTGQAIVGDSEIILKPVYHIGDPFIGSDANVDAYLVMCECYEKDGVTPHSTNKRYEAKKIFEKYSEYEAWYGIEQEFYIINNDTQRPMGFPLSDRFLPQPQQNYYCGVGGKNQCGRDFVLFAYQCALRSGLTLSGMNAEVAPGQWEIQVGPVEGITASDQLWLLRYILQRCSELYQNGSFYVDFSAKPTSLINTDFNGSGGHTNFSTKQMRNENGYDFIVKAVEKLKEKHQEHIDVYGNDNLVRLTGKHETSDMHVFSWGIGSRNTSIRIPAQVFKEKSGYLEDRRPSSNCDPYLVTSKLLESIAS